MPKYGSTYIWMIKEKNCHVVILTKTNYSKCAPFSWFGCRYTWNWLSGYLDDESISHNNENCNSLRANSPFKGYQEMSHRRHRSKVKVRAHSNVCFSLEMESMTFLSSRAHSLFSKQILKKILAIYILSNIYFTSTSPFSPISTNPKQFFTLTCAWQKKSPHMWDTIMLKCTLQWRLLLYWTVSALLIFSQFL